MEIVFIVIGALIFLFIVFYIIKKRKKKQKDWLLFEKTEGYETNPRKSYFVIHRKTGEQREAHQKTPKLKHQQIINTLERIDEKLERRNREFVK